MTAFDRMAPSLRGGTSQAAIQNQGLTYNQPGITYNAGTVTYGGLYGNSDIIPSFHSSIFSVVPSGVSGASQGSISSQLKTYNEALTSYNDSVTTYGGLYGNSDVLPSFFSYAFSLSPRGLAGTSQAHVLDQSITYNQTGVSYDNAGYQYGGLYGFAYADFIPRITGADDFYIAINISRTLGRGMLIGILGMTYPQDIVVNS